MSCQSSGSRAVQNTKSAYYFIACAALVPELGKAITIEFFTWSMHVRLGVNKGIVAPSCFLGAQMAALEML